MLKLPKSLQAHPKLAALEAKLAAHASPLRSGGTALAVKLPLDDAFMKALRVAYGTGHVVQGLELIAQAFAKEQKGLRLLQEKTGQAPARRASRLLILAGDGAERFYRDAEKVAVDNADRLLCLLIDTDSAALGAAFTAKGKPAKALAIDDKIALALFLSAYADAL